MSRRIYLSGADAANFPFFFGQPFFQGVNIKEYPIDTDRENDEDEEELSRIHDNSQSKADTLYDADDDEIENKESSGLNYIKDESNYSSERLRIDPNYKWLLKDLNLSNDTRVIDVTDLLVENEIKKNTIGEQIIFQVKEQDFIQTNETTKNFDHSQAQIIPTLVDTLLNTSKDQDATNGTILEEQKLDETNFKNDTSKLSESYDEDHQNDHNFISKLYERLVKPIYGNDLRKGEMIEENEEEEEEDSDEGDKTHNEANNFVFKEWSEKNKNQESTNTETDSSEVEENQPKNSFRDPKKKPKFSKSFEVSIESMDNLIDRVDNGIKLKRGRANNNKEKIEPNQNDNSNDITKEHNIQETNKQHTKSKSEMTDEDQSKIVESLKQEWSCMFNRLETDYRSKLDEQQKLNDLKLKSLHDEIRKCMIEQEKFLTKQQQQQLQQQRLLEEEITSKLSSPRTNVNNNNDFKSTITIETSYSKNNNICGDNNCMNGIEFKKCLVDASTSTSSDQVNTNSIVDNAKYISNLRMELKSKHARHIQDLKDYYEKEMEDLRKKLNVYTNKFGDKVDDENESMTNDYEKIENEYKLRLEQLALTNSELKESNEALLNKLAECSDHIKFLKHENFELESSLSQMDAKLKYSEEKIQALEESYTHLESQLTEAIKLQDKYVRELQMEKRNSMKKTQENEDFQMNIKYYEQKCNNYELKLDEKDTTISRLKSKLAQMETDMVRLDHEYQRLKSAKCQSSYSNINQAPFTASTTSSLRETAAQNQPLQLPIKNQNRYGSNPNFSTINQNGSPNNLNTNTGHLNNSPNGVNRHLVNQQYQPTQFQPPQPSQQQPTLTVLCGSTSQPTINQLSSSSSSSKSPGAARSRSPSLSKNRYSHKINGNNNHNSNNNNNNNHDIDEDKFNSRPPHPPPQPQQNLLQSDDTVKYKNHSNHVQINNNNNNNNLNHLEQEDIQAPTSYIQYNNSNNRNYNQNRYNNSNQSSNTPQTQHFKITNLSPEKQIKYIQQLENDFDLFMKQRQQLEAKLTRLPYKTSNPNTHSLRENLEDELGVVEKKLASLKLEMRKLNIIKSH